MFGNLTAPTQNPALPKGGILGFIETRERSEYHL